MVALLQVSTAVRANFVDKPPGLLPCCNTPDLYFVEGIPFKQKMYTTKSGVLGVTPEYLGGSKKITCMGCVLESVVNILVFHAFIWRPIAPSSTAKNSVMCLKSCNDRAYRPHFPHTHAPPLPASTTLPLRVGVWIRTGLRGAPYGDTGPRSVICFTFFFRTPNCWRCRWPTHRTKHWTNIPCEKTLASVCGVKEPTLGKDNLSCPSFWFVLCTIVLSCSLVLSWRWSCLLG